MLRDNKAVKLLCVLQQRLWYEKESDWCRRVKTCEPSLAESFTQVQDTRTRTILSRVFQNALAAGFVPQGLGCFKPSTANQGWPVAFTLLAYSARRRSEGCKSSAGRRAQNRPKQAIVLQSLLAYNSLPKQWKWFPTYLSRHLVTKQPRTF